MGSIYILKMGNNSLLLHLIPLSKHRLCNYLGFKTLGQKTTSLGIGRATLSALFCTCF